MGRLISPRHREKRSSQRRGVIPWRYPWEVVKSIELSDNWDRRDALPIDLLRNPASRPVRLSSRCWKHPAKLSFNSSRAGGSLPPSLLQPFTPSDGVGLSPAGGAGRFSLNAHSPGSDLSLGYHLAAGHAALIPCAYDNLWWRNRSSRAYTDLRSVYHEAGGIRIKMWLQS